MTLTKVYFYTDDEVIERFGYALGGGDNVSGR